jgi:hypothetical protein
LSQQGVKGSNQELLEKEGDD